MARNSYKIVTNNKLQMVKEPTDLFGTKIKSYKEASDFLRKLYDPMTIDLYETFYVLLLNRSNVIIGYSEISKGGSTATVVDNKILFSTILKTTMVQSIVLSHNHPSGQLKPSKQDIDLTRQIQEIGLLLDITVLDHIIMTTEGKYSFAEEGLL